MDYKEKLRLAKEALDSGSYDKETIEYIFPELKESEDERIRKEIISFLKEGKPYYCPNSIRRQEWWAWLEKQGEQTHTDKVEPKFKVGDWIITSEGTLRHIIDVGKTGYGTDKGWLTHEDYEKNFHLWTIEDAKDGDVLATDNNNICVFNGTVEDGKYPFAYCGLTGYHGFEVYDMKRPFTHNDVHPATKEQRDTLFSKMKEAGYEWDFEKKELKKIEQKNIEGTFINVDDVRENFVREVYRVLANDTTNDRANDIIYYFDSLPTIYLHTNKPLPLDYEWL